MKTTSRIAAGRRKAASASGPLRSNLARPLRAADGVRFPAVPGLGRGLTATALLPDNVRRGRAAGPPAPFARLGEGHHFSLDHAALTPVLNVLRRPVRSCPWIAFWSMAPMSGAAAGSVSEPS